MTDFIPYGRILEMAEEAYTGHGFEGFARFKRMLGNSQQGEAWRPIETAPKDGRRILLANEHGVWMAEYRPVYQSGYRPDNPWSSVMLNLYHIPVGVRHKRATHWMPLPDPPCSEATPPADTAALLAALDDWNSTGDHRAAYNRIRALATGEKNSGR